MRKNNICSLELCELLRDLGFNESCNFSYIEEDKESKHCIVLCGDAYYDNCMLAKSNQIASAPHIYDAKKWVEENFNVIIQVEYHFEKNDYTCDIFESEQDEIRKLKNIINGMVNDKVDLRNRYANEKDALELTIINFLKNKLNG